MPNQHHSTKFSSEHSTHTAGQTHILPEDHPFKKIFPLILLIIMFLILLGAVWFYRDTIFEFFSQEKIPETTTTQTEPSSSIASLLETTTTIPDLQTINTQIGYQFMIPNHWHLNNIEDTADHLYLEFSDINFWHLLTTGETNLPAQYLVVSMQTFPIDTQRTLHQFALSQAKNFEHPQYHSLTEPDKKIDIISGTEFGQPITQYVMQLNNQSYLRITTTANQLMHYEPDINRLLNSITPISPPFPDSTISTYLTASTSTDGNFVFFDRLSKPVESQQLLLLPLKPTTDSLPFTEQQLSALLWNAPNSLTDYFLQLSENQFWLQGTIASPVTNYTAIINQQTCQLDTQQLSLVLAEQNLELTNYQYLLLVQTPNATCPTIKTLHTQPHILLLNGLPPQLELIQAISKTLGLGKSSLLNCGEFAINEYAQCHPIDQADPFSLTGTPTFPTNLNILHRHALQWITNEEINFISQSGTYDLYASTSSSSQYRGIAINKPDTAETYYLEFRPSSGLDNHLPQTANTGALLYLGYSLPHHQGNQVTNQPYTYLLDTHPQQPGSNQPFTDGTTFFDQINRIAITQISHDTEKVTLRINFGS